MNPASIIAAVVVAAVHALLLINVLGGYTKGERQTRCSLFPDANINYPMEWLWGCRTVKGGGTPCLPMLEKVDVLSLWNR